MMEFLVMAYWLARLAVGLWFIYFVVAVADYVDAWPF